ncbi:conserved Plasmodium protein, unknown function [Plasmodium malariae]|uniref:Uncharacterized protein n=1 Tax=Plasmodium malariae TaxID=5858 RepID=A0A1C3KY27_PLAMA|nr:conserved Plasmodium protein, unknown function [Plasmodium malariae]
MVLKDKRKKKKSSKYTKKKKANIFTERENKVKSMYSNEKEYYDESGLLNYDSNDDVLIKNEELCSYMLQSGDELDKKSEKEKMNYSNINKGEEQHIDFLLTSIAFNIPLGMI